MSLFAELKRRNVFKVATAYVVVGWLLTEIATTLLPTFGAPEWVAKVVIFVFALGFVPVLVFSWAFELTPDGIKREKDVDRSASITSETGKKLNYATIAAVVAGVAFLALTRSGVGPVAPQQDEVVATEGAPSVAVLPFVNMSGNADNEYFSDGLTETLLHMLAQIPELRVAARTSSFAFKGRDTDIREIADALDVAHVLEDSVQRSGDRVRVTAQLIRANDGFHVWSENFDRTLDDIFAIQDEIASHVGDALSASLLGDKTPAPIIGVGTENLEAYDKFLRATADQLKGSYGSLQSAEGLLKDALALDPGFTDAKTLLGRVYLDQWKTGLRRGQEGIDETIFLLEQVLHDRPDDVRARTTLLEAEMFNDLWASRLDAMRDTVTLLEELAERHPNNVETVMVAAEFIGRFGSPEKATRMLEGLAEVDPLNPAVYYTLAGAYFELKNWEAARNAALRSLELEPHQPNGHSAVAETYRQEGDTVGFLRGYLDAMEVDPQDHELPGEVARELYRIELGEYAREYRRRVLAIAPTSPIAYMVNILDARSRLDFDEARSIAHQAIEDDIANRQGSYEEALRTIVRDAVRNGTAEDTLRYLEEQIPGLSDVDVPPSGLKELIARFVVSDLWKLTVAEDEWRRRMQIMYDIGRKFGREPEDRGLASAAFFRQAEGDRDGAIEKLVEMFDTDPVSKHLEWDLMMQSPALANLVDDPRIQAGMAKYEKDEAALRDSVLVFLQGRNQGSSR